MKKVYYYLVLDTYDPMTEKERQEFYVLKTNDSFRPNECFEDFNSVAMIVTESLASELAKEHPLRDLPK